MPRGKFHLKLKYGKKTMIIYYLHNTLKCKKKSSIMEWC